MPPDVENVEEVVLDQDPQGESGINDAFKKIDFSALDEAPEEDAPQEQQKEVAKAEPKAGKPAGDVVPKVDGKPDAKPVAKEAAVPSEDKDIDEISLRPGSRPDVEDNFKKVKGIAKTERQLRRQAEAKIAEVTPKMAALEQQIAELKKNPVSTEEVKKLKDELEKHKHYQFLLDPENSEYVNKEFNEKLKGLNSTAEQILKELGLPEKSEGNELSIESLQKAGGITSRPFDWWEANVLDKLPPLQRQRLTNKIIEAFETEQAKKEAIANAPKKLQEHAETTKKQREATTQADIQRAAKHIEKIQKENDWARPRELPADATPEQKAEIEEHNAMYKEAEQLLPRLYNASSPEEKMDVVVGYLYGLRLETILERTQKELETERELRAKAEEKITGIKKAGNTRAEKGGGTIPVPKPGFLKTSVKDNFAALDGE